jgi:tryptophan-rich sensory protein
MRYGSGDDRQNMFDTQPLIRYKPSDADERTVDRFVQETELEMQQRQARQERIKNMIILERYFNEKLKKKMKLQIISGLTIFTIISYLAWVQIETILKYQIANNQSEHISSWKPIDVVTVIFTLLNAMGCLVEMTVMSNKIGLNHRNASSKHGHTLVISSFLVNVITASFSLIFSSIHVVKCATADWVIPKDVQIIGLCCLFSLQILKFYYDY